MVPFAPSAEHADRSTGKTLDADCCVPRAAALPRVLGDTPDTSPIAVNMQRSDASRQIISTTRGSDVGRISIRCPTEDVYLVNTTPMV